MSLQVIDKKIYTSADKKGVTVTLKIKTQTFLPPEYHSIFIPEDVLEETTNRLISLHKALDQQKIIHTNLENALKEEIFLVAERAISSRL